MKKFVKSLMALMLSLCITVGVATTSFATVVTLADIATVTLPTYEGECTATGSISFNQMDINGDIAIDLTLSENFALNEYYDYTVTCSSFNMGDTITFFEYVTVICLDDNSLFNSTYEKTYLLVILYDSCDALDLYAHMVDWVCFASADGAIIDSLAMTTLRETPPAEEEDPVVEEDTLLDTVNNGFIGAGASIESFFVDGWTSIIEMSAMLQIVVLVAFVVGVVLLLIYIKPFVRFIVWLVISLYKALITICKALLKVIMSPFSKKRRK